MIFLPLQDWTEAKTSRREPNPTAHVADPTSVRFQECVCMCVCVDGRGFYLQHGDRLAGLHNFKGLLEF